MKRIILTRGIPASGKSTWAKQEVLKDPEHSIRINRDDLRNMSGKYWVPAREHYIKACKGIITHGPLPASQIRFCIHRSHS